MLSVRKLNDGEEGIARLALAQAVEYLCEDTTHGAWSRGNYRVEVRRGAWQHSPATALDLRELPFARLVEHVSCHVSLGIFFHPRRVEGLDRYVRAMTWFLKFNGWTVEQSNAYQVILRFGNRKMTFSCEKGEGLMLAVAIFVLFPQTICR